MCEMNEFGACCCSIHWPFQVKHSMNPPLTLRGKSNFELGFVVFKKLIVAFYLHQQNHLCHIMVICDHDNQEGTSCTFTFNT